MKRVIFLLFFLFPTYSLSEAKGLECESESSFTDKIKSENLDTYWYRIDLDKGRVLYNSTSQSYLTKLKDLIGDKLRGDVYNLYWRENKSIEVVLNRQSLEMTKLNIVFKCISMTEDQVIRKRNAYFKERQKKNKI
tara:strand:+ start:233 stop:640 length:408 start_codon:yes stop_codon:yes gene_type:complete